MQEEKRLWFFYSKTDAAGVKRLLNEQANQGWALAEDTDCTVLFVHCKRTQRTELRYDVRPADPIRNRETLEKQVSSREAGGWTPIATINGMDIYQSMPCRALTEEPEQPMRLRLWVLPLVVALIAAELWAFGQSEWYLSDAASLLRLGLPLGVLALLCALWTLLRRLLFPAKEPIKAGMWLRSVVKVLGAVWLMVLALAVLNDTLYTPWWLMVLPVLIAIWCWGARRAPERCRALLALVLGVCYLCALIGTHYVPTGRQSTQARIYTQRPVLTAETIGVADLADASFTFCYLETEDSVLVHQTTYMEQWTLADDTELVYTSTVYQCAVIAVAEELAERLTAAGSRPTSCLYRSGKTLLLLEGTVDWDFYAEAVTAQMQTWQ